MPDAPLVPPSQIVIGLASAAGPLARAASRLSLPPTALSVVNASAAAAAIGLITLDPLREAASGLEVAADLTAEPAAATTIAPGATALFTLGGNVPARPGRYATVARLAADPPVTVPLLINVAAANQWGIGLMLLGLLMAGLLGVLTGESEVSRARRDAVQARQDIHNLLAANPPPLAMAGARAAMDAEFAAAIASLGARPPVSIVDHRASDAAPHLQAANAAASQLRAALANQPPGAAEVADLAAQWQSIRPTVESLRQSPAPQPSPPQPQAAPTLANRLDASLAEYRSRILLGPANTLAADVDAALARARLELAAGEGELAASRARNQATWLRRGVRQLDAAVTGSRAWLRQAGAMLNADRSVRAALARDALPANDAATVTGHLDQAGSLLAAHPWPQGFADASHEINLARTALTAAESRASLARFQQQIAATNAATDTADIDRLIDTLRATPHPTEAEKRAGLARVLALWRTHVAGIDDHPATRARFTAALDALDATVAHGKLADLSAPYRQLGDDWVAWSTELMHRDAAASNRPVCRIGLTDVQNQLADITASLQEDPALDPTHALDRQRDLLDRDVRDLGPNGVTQVGAPGSADCLPALQAVQDRAGKLSGAILGLQLRDAAIAESARAQFAREAGLSVTETMASRRLLLTPATPAEDIVAGNQVAFSLAQADPNWGSAVSVHIDYGDGATLDTDAESLRQGRQPIVHAYRHAGPVDIAVTARVQGQAAPAGAGRNSLTVLRSPVSALTALADLLTNIRFAIALLLALVVYYWRFRERAATFGARGFDYVEAFALGFAASAATDALPALLTKLVAI